MGKARARRSKDSAWSLGLIKPGRVQWLELAHGTDSNIAVSWGRNSSNISNSGHRHNGGMLQPSGATMLNNAFIIGVGGACGSSVDVNGSVGTGRLVVGIHGGGGRAMVIPLEEA